MKYEGNATYMGYEWRIDLWVAEQTFSTSIRIDQNDAIDFKGTRAGEKLHFEAVWLIRPYGKLQSMELMLKDEDHDGEIVLATLWDKDRLLPESASYRRFNRILSRLDSSVLGSWAPIPVPIYIKASRPA